MNKKIEKELNTGLDNPINNNTNTAVSPQCEQVDKENIPYCEVCHEPLIKFLDKPIGDVKYHPRNCKCKREELEREAKREELEKHRKIVEENTRNCFSQYSMKEWNFSNDTEDNDLLFFKDYVSHWEEMKEKNAGLIITGEVGVGKSFTAACIANELLEQEVRVKMTNFGTILDDLYKEVDKTEYIKALCRYDLLIIDDLSTERDTPFALECIFKVVDERCKQNKPLIITTNLPVEEIRNAKRIDHQRIYDRILLMCIPTEMKGENLRIKKRKEKIKYVEGLHLGERT